MNAEKRTSRLWAGAAACFLALVSTSSFGVHLDHFFQSEVEGLAAPIWRCTVLANPTPPHIGYDLPGSPMGFEACFSASRNKVLELSADFLASYPSGSCGTPIREDSYCVASPPVYMLDPVTGLPVHVYEYASCGGFYIATCLFYANYPAAGGLHPSVGIGGIAGPVPSHGPPGYGPYGFFVLVDQCPVANLKDKPTDACSVALETGRGLPIPATACPSPSVMTDPRGEQCLRGKLGALGIPYAGPTATIRTAAYQEHLKEVFDKFWQHQWLITDPVVYQACTAKRAIVEAEMSKHGIDYPPARIDSAHLDGTAFDISRTTVNRIADVPALLKAVPACNLEWGGGFPVPDEVHFFTPPPVPAP